jgi:hypothetical protein
MPLNSQKFGAVWILPTGFAGRSGRPLPTTITRSKKATIKVAVSAIRQSKLEQIGAGRILARLLPTVPAVCRSVPLIAIKLLTEPFQICDSVVMVWAGKVSMQINALSQPSGC